MDVEPVDAPSDALEVLDLDNFKFAEDCWDFVGVARGDCGGGSEMEEGALSKVLGGVGAASSRTRERGASSLAGAGSSVVVGCCVVEGEGDDLGVAGAGEEGEGAEASVLCWTGVGAAGMESSMVMRSIERVSREKW